MLSAAQVFKRQFKREVLVRFREPRLIVHALLFFLMMLAFFPLSFTASPQYLHNIAPGLIWIALLFAALLSSEGLFQQAFNEGVLEQAYLSGESMGVMIFASLFVQLVSILVPIFLFCPLIGLLFAFTPHEVGRLILSLLCGAPALFGLTALAGALSVGRVQKEIVTALLVLPLSIPLMIFGSAVMQIKSQEVVSGMIALLLACSLLAQGILPLTIAAILRLRLGD